MARRSNTEMNTIEDTAKKIIKDEKLDGPQDLQEKLKSRFGIDISKQTAIKLFGKYETQPMSPPSSTDIALEYENNPEIVKINERIKKLESDFDNATTASDRQKFNTALNDTQESKLKLKKILREAEMLKRTSDKKTIVVTFGIPDVIPIDKTIKIKKEEIKKPFFKADDVQKTIPVDGDEK